MVKPICGKVARVLNKHEIAVNVGTAHGVAVGMYFDVIDAHELDIKDPDTGEVLGSIERGKIRVKIIYAQEKLSVAAASPFLSARQLASSGYRSSRPLGPFAQSLMSAETKSSSEKEFSYAKVGDAVVQVIEDNETEAGNEDEK